MSHGFFRGTDHAHRAIGELVAATRVELDEDEITHLMARLDVTLRRHFEVEDKELYPTLLDAVRDWDDRSTLLGAHEEHRIIMRLLDDLEDTVPSNERFRGKVHALYRFWQHHIEEEDGTLYDMARRYLDHEQFFRLQRRIQEEEKAQRERREAEDDPGDKHGGDTRIAARSKRQRRGPGAVSADAERARSG